MTYGQVIMILFVGLVLYYAFLIFTDIQKARAAEAAEQENHMEEDIDISEEARSFQPKKVNREEPKKEEENKKVVENKESSDNGEQQENSNNEGKEEFDEPEGESERPASENNQDTETAESDEEQDDTESNTSDDEELEESTEDAPTEEQSKSEEQSSRTTYREAIMTDGILADDIFKVIDRLAETGECDLGTIIYSCENMRFAG